MSVGQSRRISVKSKKLLISLIVVAAVVVAIVVLASVFALKETIVVCHNFAGDKITGEKGSPDEQTVLDLFKGKSTVLLNKDKVIKELEKLYPDWHVVGIVKNPPNCLEVHFLKRVAVAKLDVGGKDVYLDSFGYQIATPTESNAIVPIDISSAFVTPAVALNVAQGEKFSFENPDNNARLSCILETLMALWQCRVEIADFPTILGETNVFSFDNNGTMTITTRVGAKIHFMNPQEVIRDKFIKAFSVYCSEQYDLQKKGVEVTVWPDGKITTPEKDITRI